MNKKNYKPFEFKEFTIHQNNAAMKIGTDGILLGAWADLSDKKKGIDIGSGTGVISIMLCQRNEILEIDSIEVSERAVVDAKKNIKNCKWNKRIKLKHADLKLFSTENKYDLIISNPPYFKKSLKPKDLDRLKARHEESLNYKDVLNFSEKHLLKNGTINLILPIDQKQEVIEYAEKFGLYVNKECIVFPKPNKNPHRLLIELSKTKKTLESQSLIIENDGRHNYTDNYKKLTREFYTIFD